MAVAPATDVRLHPLSVEELPQRIDRGRKLAIYARAGLPEYWIVDLVERCIDVHRSPERESYAEVLRVAPGESLTPSGVDVPPLDVAALLSDTS